MTVNPYLNFDGNTEEAFHFYAEVFGTEFSALERFGDSEAREQISPSEYGKIMHIALPLGNGATLMATDTLKSFGQTLEAGNNFYISLSPESESKTDTLFQALSDGGEVLVPMHKAFWGSYFGVCKDKYGVQWMMKMDLK